MLKCPCCGGEVTDRSYSFTVIRHADHPALFEVDEFFACGKCEEGLTGSNPTIRDALKDAFLEHLKKVEPRG